jgi:hypothetical protein
VEPPRASRARAGLSDLGATGQEVRAAAPQLARARAAEREALAALAHETLDLVEEGRCPLHLVDHDPGARRQRGALVAERGRVALQAQALAGPEQEVGRSVGEV